MDHSGKDEVNTAKKDNKELPVQGDNELNCGDDENPGLESQVSLKRKLDSTRPIPTPNAEQHNPLPTWVAGASPAKFVTLDELMDMSKAMENMALVHEMAVNPEFVIPETSNNPFEKVVKDCVHKIFWDKMKDDMNKQPPDYTSAFRTLLDVKKMIFDLLTPQHVRLKMEIDSRLDEKLLEQQMNNSCLDWKRLSEYLIDLLGRLCAPVRDEMVAHLREKTDIVDILRGICELLELMKIDMANFEVKLNRTFIEDHSAVYERNQFFKLLEKDSSLEESVSNWLERHIDSVISVPSTSDTSEPLIKRRFEELNNSEVGAIISNAYMELLEWENKHPYPSTMLVDRSRLEQLSSRYLQLITCTSCVLVTCVSVGQSVVDTAEFKQKLKDELMAITEGIKGESISDMLEAVYVHCNRRAFDLYTRREGTVVWTDENSKSLKLQIMSLENKENSVRHLMRNVFTSVLDSILLFHSVSSVLLTGQRIHDFVLSLLKCEQQSSRQQQLPAGVSMVREELNTFTASFIRLVTHNRKVFGVYYGGIIKKLMSV